MACRLVFLTKTKLENADDYIVSSRGHDIADKDAGICITKVHNEFEGGLKHRNIVKERNGGTRRKYLYSFRFKLKNQINGNVLLIPIKDAIHFPHLYDALPDWVKTFYFSN